MDSKTEIVDHELADPEANSDQEARSGDKRRWTLLKSFALFAAAYSSLHKLFLPLALHLTLLRTSPYAQLDPWILAVAPWAYLIWREQLPQLASALSSALIAHAAFQLWAVAQGHYAGWLMFSHLLSSVPPAVASLLLLVRAGHRVRPLWAWSGAVIAAGISLVSFQDSTAPVAAPIHRLEQQSQPEALLPRPNCGGQHFRVDAESEHNFENIVSIGECGLKPAILSVTPGQRLQLINNTSHPMNIHYYKKHLGRFEQSWNLLLPSKSKRLSPEIRLEEDAIGLLFSDAYPQIGLTGLRATNSTRSWELSRSPLQAVEISK